MGRPFGVALLVLAASAAAGVALGSRVAALRGGRAADAAAVALQHETRQQSQPPPTQGAADMSYIAPIPFMKYGQSPTVFDQFRAVSREFDEPDPYGLPSEAVAIIAPPLNLPPQRLPSGDLSMTTQA